MALIKCPECSAEISDRARCCPKCGALIIVHKWRCSKCGNMISEEPCPYCRNAQTAVNTNTRGYESSAGTTTTSVAKKKRNLGELSTFLVIIVIAIINIFPWNTSYYYVAKLPSFNAGTVKVDGYMHKDKSCCQKVANKFGAEVIRVKPNNEAGVNEYGQSVSYEAAFYYCPLCCD